MKIAVFSDSHSDVMRIIGILKKEPADLVLHLGDMVRDALRLQGAFPEIPVLIVKGNNDFLSTAPSERVERVSGLTLFMTHGHRYPFGYEAKELYRDAVGQSADIALFGHTHVPCLERRGPLLILNPGSISLPRRGLKPSWARITIDEAGNVTPEIVEG